MKEKILFVIKNIIFILLLTTVVWSIVKMVEKDNEATNNCYIVLYGDKENLFTEEQEKAIKNDCWPE